MSRFFGKTWWGNSFLNSLSKIDFSNRLPRGSRYARTGLVKDINITKNQITAKVQGSRIDPYKVDISIPAFDNKQVKLFINGLLEHPAIIANLMNGELNEDVHQIADKHDLKIFPNSWEDFSMRCSCPDHAVPCKHIAAIIYLLSREIDNNPFLLFELRDIYLRKELEKKGISSQTKLITVPSLNQLLNSFSLPNKESKNIFDLSKINDLSESLFVFLDDEPAFYTDGNFKKYYTTIIKSIGRTAQKIWEGKMDLTEFIGKNDVKAELNLDDLKYEIDKNGNSLALQDQEKVNTFYSLHRLIEIDPLQLSLYNDPITIWKDCLDLALNLIAKGAIVPKIFTPSENILKVHWFPATINSEVKNSIQSLREGDGELQFHIECNKENSANEIFWLTSVFITVLLNKISFHSNLKIQGNEFKELFFLGSRGYFEGIAEQSIGKSIARWLSLYDYDQSDFQAVVEIEEQSNEIDFMLSLSVKSKSEKLATLIPLQEILQNDQYKNHKFEILKNLSLLGRFIPQVNSLINTASKNASLSNKEMYEFLSNSKPALQLLGIEIMLPKSLKNLISPKKSVKLSRSKSEKSVSSSFLRLEKLLDFEWRVALGNEVISFDKFEKLIIKSENLIKYKSKYISLSDEELQKFLKEWNAKKELSHIDVLRIALGDEYNGAKVEMTEDVQNLITELTHTKEEKVPAGIRATLRPYQKRGYSWLYKNSRLGFGSVLADDMGLGKTLQVITTLQKFKDDGIFKDGTKALVIVPTSLIYNWQAEIDKFAPELKYFVFHGSNRNLTNLKAEEIVLTTYGLVRNERAKLSKLNWHVIVIDEAQHIKNHNTQQSKSVKALKANTYFAMSGTPVENRLSEFWSIMEYCNKGYLGNQTYFRKKFSTPIQKNRDQKAALAFKTLTAPFLMRRLKTDKSIISDLPEKIESDRICNLTKEQTALYETVLKESMAALEDNKNDKGKHKLFKKQGIVLQMIIALKQICNHPSQFLKQKEASIELSGKAQMLIELLETILNNNEKVLIFTQFKEMGKLLNAMIQEHFNRAPLFFHGGLSLKKRNELVENFQNNKASNIFVLTIKSAGTGLNLTAASHVIHYDLWWNPAVEAQATDRAYRIGQNKNVLVQRFITANTFEEQINKMIQAKKELAEMTVSTGENWIGQLSNQEIKDLFTLKQ